MNLGHKFNLSNYIYSIFPQFSSQNLSSILNISLTYPYSLSAILYEDQLLQ